MTTSGKDLPKPLLTNGTIRLKACRTGPLLYNIQDVYIGRSLELYGELSAAEAAIYRQVLKPGMTAIDAGANIGCHTVLMGQLVGPNGRVHAFEAQRQIHQLLCANVALNTLDNVHTHHRAVGRDTGEIQVPAIDYTKPGNFGGVSLATADNDALTDDHGWETVPLTTIDALSLKACHLIKIDVEGMEQEVLRGARETLKAHQPILYVENDRRDRADALADYLLGAGYRLYWHLPPLYNPDNFFGNEENVFGNIISRNMLCIHVSRTTRVEHLQEITERDFPLFS